MLVAQLVVGIHRLVQAQPVLVKICRNPSVRLCTNGCRACMPKFGAYASGPGPEAPKLHSICHEANPNKQSRGTPPTKQTGWRLLSEVAWTDQAKHQNSHMGSDVHAGSPTEEGSSQCKTQSLVRANMFASLSYSQQGVYMVGAIQSKLTCQDIERKSNYSQHS